MRKFLTTALAAALSATVFATAASADQWQPRGEYFGQGRMHHFNNGVQFRHNYMRHNGYIRHNGYLRHNNFAATDYGHRYIRHHNGGNYYNGYYGSRHYHHGWRHHNGWWFPAAAFLGGVVTGDLIAGGYAPYYYDNGPYYYDNDVYVVRRGGLTQAHVDWCYARYRSYRAWDNTYQPYEGPRRQCYSPYS